MWEKSLKKPYQIKLKELGSRKPGWIRPEGELIRDKNMIDAAIDCVFKRKSKQVDAYKNGRKQFYWVFFGCTMKELKGQGDASTVKHLLSKKLACL